MQQDAAGAYIMRQGDTVDYQIDPSLSGSGWQMTREGDGDDSTLVPLTGFGIGDPTVVKARMGSLIRPFPVNLPGMDPDSPQQISYKRSFVSTVNQAGEKVVLGQWNEGAPDAPDTRST